MAPSDEFTSRFHQLRDPIFSDLIGGRGGSASSRAPTDVYLTENPPTLNVTVDIAGLDPQALEVVLEDQVLVIRGGRRRPPEPGRRIYQHVEIDWAPFERHIRLGTPVDPTAASVSYERGLLQIALPLTQRPVVARVLIGVRIPG